MNIYHLSVMFLIILQLLIVSNISIEFYKNLGIGPSKTFMNLELNILKSRLE